MGGGTIGTPAAATSGVPGLVTPPAIEPVTVVQAKTHLRVTAATDDTYIGIIITSAREWVEMVSGRSFITQTWDMYLDRFPVCDDFIELPRPPLQSVTSVKYTESDDTENTFNASNYDVDDDRDPGRVVLGYTKSWPTATLRPMSPVVVRFVSGYGDSTTNVPERFRQAIQFLVGEMYENREPQVTGTIVSALPTLKRLITVDGWITL
jgi:uncharacterized phiE125 gp8 family phage protein